MAILHIIDKIDMSISLIQKGKKSKIQIVAKIYLVKAVAHI